MFRDSPLSRSELTRCDQRSVVNGDSSSRDQSKVSGLELIPRRDDVSARLRATRRIGVPRVRPGDGSRLLPGVRRSLARRGGILFGRFGLRRLNAGRIAGRRERIRLGRGRAGLLAGRVRLERAALQQRLRFGIELDFLPQLGFKRLVQGDAKPVLLLGIRHREPGDRKQGIGGFHGR